MNRVNFFGVKSSFGIRQKTLADVDSLPVMLGIHTPCFRALVLPCCYIFSYRYSSSDLLHGQSLYCRWHLTLVEQRKVIILVSLWTQDSLLSNSNFGRFCVSEADRVRSL